jgi:hypothetical protein
MLPWWIAVWTCWLVLHTVRAQAEETGREAAYDAALDRALGAHASGDYTTAEVAMREALALSTNARTLRGLGVILYAQERYVEAIDPLEAALVNELKPLPPELRASVDELLQRIWQRVGRLTLRIEPPEAEVLIDGKVPAAHGPAECVLAAGEHDLRIRAPEREPYDLSLRTRAGSRDSLHVVLARLAQADTGPSSVTSQGGPWARARRVDDVWTPVVRNAVLVSGAVVALAGAATWLTGYLRFRELETWCEDMPGGACTEAPQERYDQKRIEPLTTTGIVLMGTGAAALLVGGSLELWRWHSRTRLRATGHGLSLRHAF